MTRAAACTRRAAQPATNAAPITPPAPARLSMMTLCPQASLELLADRAGDDVVRAAGGKRNHKGDVLTDTAPAHLSRRRAARSPRRGRKGQVSLHRRLLGVTLSGVVHFSDADRYHRGDSHSDQPSDNDALERSCARTDRGRRRGQHRLLRRRPACRRGLQGHAAGTSAHHRRHRRARPAPDEHRRSRPATAAPDVRATDDPAAMRRPHRFWSRSRARTPPRWPT